MSRTDAPGSSDSACPSERVQVTAAAEGTSPAAAPICCRLRFEIIPVVPAGKASNSRPPRGLGERQRLAAERLDQVNGALALGRIRAEPLGQAVEGLADAVEPDRHNLSPASPRGDRGV